ncbi:hypothetical protein ABN028_09530 [Actinopolymorpha sp. B17G11]|uniref:hypothetical protein n=1 Tax=Actinopolymorpha sp. B17G11 TaxID=3160861 RepID=UPI0032E446C2
MSKSTRNTVDPGVNPLRVSGDLTPTTYLDGSAVNSKSGPHMLLVIGLGHNVDLWIEDLETLDRLTTAIEQARTAFLNLDTHHIQKAG